MSFYAERWTDFSGLMDRFRQSQNRADIDAAIRLADETAASSPRGAPDWLIFTDNAAYARAERYRVFDTREDLDHAIAAYEDILATTEPDSQDWLIANANAARIWLLRYETNGDPNDLDACIEAYLISFRLPADNPTAPARVMNYVHALGTRYSRDHRPEDARAAWTAARFLIQDGRVGPKMLVVPVQNLAIMTGLHATFAQDLETIDLAQITVIELARNSSGEEHSRALSYAAKLSIARHLVSRDPADLDDAITMREILAPPEGSLELAETLIMRAVARRDLCDFDRALAIAHGIRERVPHRSSEWIKAVSLIGHGHRQRYVPSDDPRDLDESIAAYEEALLLLDERALPMSILASLFRERFRTRHDPADLEKGLRLSRAAQPDMPPHERADAKTILANLLRSSFDLHGRREDLDESIMVLREAVTLESSEEGRRALLERLGIWLLDHFELTHAVADAAAAATAFEEAFAGEFAMYQHATASTRAKYWAARLSNGDAEAAFDVLRRCIRTPDIRDRADALIDLAWLLIEHADAGNPDVLAETFAALDEAESAATDRDVRTRIHKTRALALDVRYEAFGDPADVERLAFECERAFALAEPEPSKQREAELALSWGLTYRGKIHHCEDDLSRALSLARSAAAGGNPKARDFLPEVLSALFEEKGDRSLLDEAIEILERRRSRTSAPHTLGEIERNLGFMLFRRYGHLHDREDLLRAIEACRSALTRDPTDRNARADVLGNLGTDLRLRFELDGNVINLEESVACLIEALEIRGPRSSDFPLWTNQLGISLSARYGAIGRIADLDAAIDAYHAALAWGPSSAARIVRDNLAVALRLRCNIRENVADLDEAIALNDEAANELPRGSIDWIIARTNLASFRVSRFHRSHDAEDLEHALRNAREAYEASPPGSAPGVAARSLYGRLLDHRYEISRDLDDLNASIAAQEEALAAGLHDQHEAIQWQTALAQTYERRHAHTADGEDLLRAAERHRQACAIASNGLWRAATMSSGLSAAGFFVRRKRMAEAAQVIGAAIVAANENYRVQLFAPDASRAIDESERIHVLASIVFAAVGDLPRAVVTLEQGRARELRTRLLRDFADLEALAAAAPEIFEGYRRAAAQLRQLDETRMVGDPADHRRLLAHAREEFDRSVIAVRAVPGFESFLADPTIDDLAAAASSLTPLVYVVLHGMIRIALLVSRDDAGIVSVDSISLSLSGERFPDKETKAAVEELVKASGEVMQPIAELLVASGAQRVMLVPCGAASYLPLHVPLLEAGIEHVSYAPSAVSVVSARRLAATHSDAAPLLAGVGGPPAGAKPLPFAEAELRAVSVLMSSREHALLRGNDATIADFYAALGGATHLHLATHGSFDPRRVLQSSLAIGGGLTLGEIISSRARFGGLRLAVLSACRTALIDLAKQPDEAMGLPSGLLQAGVPGVIGTLWSVPDLSTALLMQRFYKEHTRSGTVTRCGDLLDPALALARAQQWLRTAQTSDIKDEVLKLGSDRARPVLQHIARVPFGTRLFEHPYFWAPFVLYGV